MAPPFHGWAQAHPLFHFILFSMILPLGTALSQLRADLYNTPAIPANATLPDGSVGLWQPTVVTLISGENEAVLIDTLFTTEQGVALSDWIEETIPDKRLTTIYITHGHGDHWFNIPYMQTRFPGVEIVSTKDSIEHMVTQITPEMRTFWTELFPNQIDEQSFQILAEPLGDNKFTLEGHTFAAVDVGHSDTDETTFLWVPALKMAVAGDIVYNDVHMWMVESTLQSQRDAWVRSLDEVAAYIPQIVVGSHHRPGGVDGAFNIEASRLYVETFGRLVGESKSAEELYDKVLDAYPNRLVRLVLWLSCQAAFPSE
ncbi:Uu.00g052850.m01.CDS01 [Anthostomella pinea]|uniref:Uu.00g052850.m01.CDS01 n=1 Tax=Anthostomella pinea TaxID=933095 RepID=A0AAI8VX87_9PEZI|nr:Uu.00g052850.m01.CDS01 [Anthostomella pinea]